MEDADEALERNVNESKEELKQWKDERIKSLQTPDIHPDDEKNDKQQECKSLEDLGTPTKQSSSSLNNAIKEQENLTSKLLYVTKENTKLLQEISKLKQQQMQLEDSLKDITDNPRDELDTTLADAEAEYKNLLAAAERRRTEIASLKSDIQRLKSKKGHVSKDTMLCKALS